MCRPRNKGADKTISSLSSTETSPDYLLGWEPGPLEWQGPAYNNKEQEECVHMDIQKENSELLHHQVWDKSMVRVCIVFSPVGHLARKTKETFSYTKCLGSDLGKNKLILGTARLNFFKVISSCLVKC